MSSKLAIGIDLGTTNSCVSIFRNGGVEIIKNDKGFSTTPSYVSFSEKRGRLVGDDAKSQAVFEPENTIFDSKRLIGRKFDDTDLQKDIQHWPFNIVDEGSKPKIEVTVKGRKKTFYPEEISSMILHKIKNIAEKYLKTEVTDCVITVPAYFNDSQRQATKDAGKIADLNVLKIINEPTAAALAYGFDKTIKGKKNILVYDLGGGTFDVSVLKFEGKNMKVLSTGGLTHLGGEDFDNRIMEYVINNDSRIKNDKKALRRLRSICSDAKISLSSAKVATIKIDSIIEDLDINKELTREKFDELNIDLFGSTIRIVIDCLNQAKLTKYDIDEVVLVGGSSRIPKVKSMVKEFFDGIDLNESINPDEAVAHGAAISAALCQGNESDELRNMSFEDVIPMSLGIAITLGLMDVIIPRNSRIPAKITKKYRTTKDNQTKIQIIVLEGESKHSKDNNVLGEFSIEGLPKKLKGEIEIVVTFAIDDNGILTIDCEETSTLIKNQITIKHNKGRLSEEDMQRIKDENKTADTDQGARKEILDEKNKIYEYCYDMKEKDQGGDLLNESIQDICNQVMEWVDANPNEQLRIYQDKYKEINDLCDKLIQKAENEKRNAKNINQYNNDLCEPVNYDDDPNSSVSDDDDLCTPVSDDDDNQLKEITRLKDTIYDYCMNTKNNIKKSSISGSEKRIIVVKCETMEKWLDSQNSAKLTVYQNEFKKLKQFCKNIM